MLTSVQATPLPELLKSCETKTKGANQAENQAAKLLEMAPLEAALWLCPKPLALKPKIRQWKNFLNVSVFAWLALLFCVAFFFCFLLQHRTRSVKNHKDKQRSEIVVGRPLGKGGIG